MTLENELKKFLDQLKTNSGIDSAILITEDGLLITGTNDFNNSSEHLPLALEMGAVTASILSMAERLITLISANNLNQIVLKTDTNENDVDMISIISSIYSNVILLVFFPCSLNMGLVLYEIENTKHLISKYLNSNQDIILHPESVL